MKENIKRIIAFFIMSTFLLTGNVIFQKSGKFAFANEKKADQGTNDDNSSEAEEKDAKDEKEKGSEKNSHKNFHFQPYKTFNIKTEKYSHNLDFLTFTLYILFHNLRI